jgi:hypothetical protein
VADNTFDTIEPTLSTPPTRPSLSANNRLKGKVHDLAISPVAGGDVLEEVRALCGSLDEAIAASAVIGGSSAAADVGSAVGAAIGGTTFLIALAIVALIVAVLIFIENILYYLPLPGLFGVGSRVQSWVRSHFQWVQDLQAKIADEIAVQVQYIVHQWFNLIKTVLIFEGVIPETNTRVVITKNSKQVDAEIAHLQAQINYLLLHMGAVQYITKDNKTVVGVPQNVWDDIHQLQDDVRSMRQDIATLQDDVERIGHTSTSTSMQLQNLTTTIHEVRAISVGWAEIQQDLSDLTTRVTHIQSTTDERLDHQGITLTAMQPLTILQGAGLRGLKTLRQLEDTPCMCPQVPGIPNEAGTALAIYEFITNG